MANIKTDDTKVSVRYTICIDNATDKALKKELERINKDFHGNGYSMCALIREAINYYVYFEIKRNMYKR